MRRNSEEAARVMEVLPDAAVGALRCEAGHSRDVTLDAVTSSAHSTTVAAAALLRGAKVAR